MILVWLFFQAEDGRRDRVRSRGLGDVYKRQELRRALQEQFQTLQMRKPAASRNRSAEIYLLARNKKA